MQGDLADSKCYSFTLRTYCVSAVDGAAVMEDCVTNVMKVDLLCVRYDSQKTIEKRDIYYDSRGESNMQKLDLIRSMLLLDPKKRITVEGALNHV